jgi:hypothetical protein
MSAKELLGDDTKLRCPVCHYDDMNFTLGMKNAGIGDVLDVFDLHDEAMPDHDLAEFVESCTPEELLSWRNNGRTVFQEAVVYALGHGLHRSPNQAAILIARPLLSKVAEIALASQMLSHDVQNY